MKIRRDFVTNSSSSSYICVKKVNMCDELRKYMKEEFGKFGERLLNEYVVSGQTILDNEEDEFNYDVTKNHCEIAPDGYYLPAKFIEWTTEGDQEGDDAFLYRNLPDQFAKEICVID